MTSRSFVAFVVAFAAGFSAAGAGAADRVAPPQASPPQVAPPPQVRIVSPASGAYVVGPTRLRAAVEPSDLATSVVFFVDGLKVCTLTATPFECETTSELPDAVACRARWVERFQRATETAEQDTVFTLDAVVIHGGRLASLAVLRANRRADASGQAEVIEELLYTVSRARSTADPT